MLKVNKKYRLTDETVEVEILDNNNYGAKEVVLHRIEALKDFGDVKKGDIGGWVESENNLSHEGDCWIYNNCVAVNNSSINDNVKLIKNCIVKDNVNISGNTTLEGINSGYSLAIYNNSTISGDITITGNGYIFGNTAIIGNISILDDILISDSKIVGNCSITGKSTICDYSIIADSIISDLCVTHGRICSNMSVSKSVGKKAVRKYICKYNCINEKDINDEVE